MGKEMSSPDLHTHVSQRRWKVKAPVVRCSTISMGEQWYGDM